MASGALLVTCLAVLGAVHAGLDVGYNSLDDLYERLARLDPQDLLRARSADLSGVSDEDEGAASWDELAPKPSSQRSSGQTDIRDSEYIGHSSNAGSQGFIYMSGGAGEGKQHLTPSGALKNIQQVKSDEALPFYCHPPNPCPKGYTSKDGCEEFIEDSADVQKAWIERMMQTGLCTCDEEHMFDCPATDSIVSAGGESKSEPRTATGDLDSIMSDLLNDKKENPYAGGQKRQSLVAKKSPRIKRDLLDDQIEKDLNEAAHKRANNPYLAGLKLPTVAKKGMPSAEDKRF